MVRGYSWVVTLQGEKCHSKVHWVGNCAVGWVCAWWFKAWIIRRGDPSSRNAILSKTEHKRFSMESIWQHWCGFSMVFLESGIQHMLKKDEKRYRASCWVTCRVVPLAHLRSEPGKRKFWRRKEIQTAQADPQLGSNFLTCILNHIHMNAKLSHSLSQLKDWPVFWLCSWT